MSVELYAPIGHDPQTPHVQDELYFIQSGTGVLTIAGEDHPFEAGTCLFVPAGVEHQFQCFSSDFSTWVVFWGPVGGEAAAVTDPLSIPGHADWRALTLDRMRALIMGAVPAIVEERKWIKPTNPAGVPVWSHAGIVCTGETYKATVKLTFAKGASLDDPAGLFNASLDGNMRRAIDVHEGETIDADAFTALVRAAVILNTSTRQTKTRRAT